MSAADDHLKLRTWLCSVVFADIVQYAAQTVEVQMDWKGRFSGYLKGSIDDVAESDRVILDTGDGAAVCFLGDPVVAMFCALKLRTAMLQDEPQRPNPMQARFGINLGSVKLIRDINGNINAVGDGINVAQRVMSFSGNNHILVSRSFYEVVSCLSESYNQLFRYGGVRKDKHVREHTVYDLMPPDGTTQSTRQTATASCEGSLAIEPAVIAKAEHLLIPLLGPIARHLTRTHANRSSSQDQFFKTLAGFILQKEECEKFLRAVGSHPTIDVSPGTKPAVVAAETPAAETDAKTRWDVERLDRARKELAVYVGPMAKVIVARACGKAQSLSELYQMLAAEIPSPEDRNKFLAAM